MKDMRPKPNRLRSGRSWCMNMPGNKYPSQRPYMRRLMPVTKSLPIVIFQSDLRNTEGCRNAKRIVKHLGVIVRKELAKIKPPVTMDERNAIVEESIALAPSPIIKHGAPGEKDT